MNTKIANLLRRHAPARIIVALRGRDPQPDPSTGRDRVCDDTQNFRRLYDLEAKSHPSHATQQSTQ